MNLSKRINPVFCLIGVVMFCVSSLGALAGENPAASTAPPVQEAQKLTLNFRGVPLDTVLDYLSKEAGYVIVKEADVTGTIDVWSHQPLNNGEAVDLLNTVLNEKGYAAIRSGRTLTVVTRESARQRELPVKTGNNPELIPKNDEMVTQIIPVRYTDATKLIENLQPLIPSYAVLSANESSNAIIITDTQKNIRRTAEIIRALDTTISGISTVRVFPLQYADATKIATVIESIFKTDTTTQGRNSRAQMMPPFMGGGRGGRGGDGGQDQSDSEAKAAASRVVAVADDRTNALVVSAPDELMPLIEKLVSEVDTMTEDITEIGVFYLQHADATEMVQVLTDLFPDNSSSSQTNQFAPRFGGGFGGRGGGMPGMPGMPGGGGGGSSGTTQSSERQLAQTTVTAVADPRTNSIVVSAARETMIQIAQMIEQLDSRQDKKQKVFVYKLDHADVDNVVEVLRNIFESSNSTISNNRNTQSSNTNTLQNRTVSTTSTNQSNR